MSSAVASRAHRSEPLANFYRSSGRVRRGAHQMREPFETPPVIDVIDVDDIVEELGGGMSECVGPGDQRS
jgi:hypothetical protein